MANEGNSLAVQWLGLRAFTAMGLGSIPGPGTKISQAMGCGGGGSGQEAQLFVLVRFPEPIG